MIENCKGKALIQLIDKKSFDALVEKWGVDNWVRKLSTWEFTGALINVMLLRIDSYREMEATLGIARSTFGDALCTKDFGFFQDLCDLVLGQIRAKTQNRKIKKALRQILAIDSTEARVHGSLFSEAGWELKRADGHQAGVKLHVVWNIDGQWVEDFRITPVRRHDSPVSLQLLLSKNKIYVFDRAYNDFDFWLNIINVASDFVTRLKDCARYRYLEMKVVNQCVDQDGVLYDGEYTPTKASSAKACQESNVHLRHIVYRDPETKRVFHFVTSDLKLKAETIASIYKQRWTVELLFRWLKGHLNIRQLQARNKNAARVQLAVAILIKLLLQLKKIKESLSGTLWDILRAIRANLNRRALITSPFPGDPHWKSAQQKHYTACTI